MAFNLGLHYFVSVVEKRFEVVEFPVVDQVVEVIVKPSLRLLEEGDFSLESGEASLVLLNVSERKVGVNLRRTTCATSTSLTG